MYCTTHYYQLASKSTATRSHDVNNYKLGISVQVGFGHNIKAVKYTKVTPKQLQINHSGTLNRKLM
jgi:hypothetical protein